MAMRYVFRRMRPDDLGELSSSFPDLGNQLGKAAENLRRFLKQSFSPMRHAQYTFVTRKTDAGWSWVCPSVELIAEDENGLFALTEKFKIPRPEHLQHLK